MERNITKPRIVDDFFEIHNPTIDKIQEGMMVRYGGKAMKGIIVAKIDIEKDQVLIGNSIGGTKEHWAWVPTNKINVVWSINKTFSEAMTEIDAFGKAIKEKIQDILRGRI